MSLSTKQPSQVKENLFQEVQDTREPKKRLNADLEASLYRRIKAQAVREDRSISDITRQLLVEYLSKNSNE